MCASVCACMCACVPVVLKVSNPNQFASRASFHSIISQPICANWTAAAAALCILVDTSFSITAAATAAATIKSYPGAAAVVAIKVYNALVDNPNITVGAHGSTFHVFLSIRWLSAIVSCVL